jgi:CxxC motif-containing protein
MIKKLTCIECPKGCRLNVERLADGIIKVSGNQCEKGERYGKAEMEQPRRILTSSVLAKGMSLKMIPVRTDKPIPKEQIFAAMSEVKKVRVTRPVKVGDIIVGNFLDLGVNLVATREATLF